MNLGYIEPFSSTLKIILKVRIEKYLELIIKWKRILNVYNKYFQLKLSFSLYRHTPTHIHCFQCTIANKSPKWTQIASPSNHVQVKVFAFFGFRHHLKFFLWINFLKEGKISLQLVEIRHKLKCNSLGNELFVHSHQWMDGSKSN